MYVEERGLVLSQEDKLFQRKYLHEHPCETRTNIEGLDIKLEKIVLTLEEVK